MSSENRGIPQLLNRRRVFVRNEITGMSIVGAGALLMLVAGSASAVGLSNVSTNNTNIAYWSLNTADCTLTKSTIDPGPATRTAIVQGTNTPCVAPTQPGGGGNIELGDDDAVVWDNPSTLSGTLPQGPLTLSSLTLADWTSQVAPGVTLAKRYISDAILANCGVLIPPALLGDAEACFLSGSAADCGGLIDPPPAEKASDPNVSYANSVGNLVTIGLAGPLNATGLLPTGFTCPDGTTPDPLQLSEVVKFEAAWAPSPQYLYGFNATPSGLQTDDPTRSYDAIYDVKVNVQPTPIPAVQPLGLALLSFGLMVAAGWARRRRR